MLSADFQSIHFDRSAWRRLAALLWAPLALGLLQALPAHAADNVPPPGLYRVDSNGTTRDRDGSVQRQHSGIDGTGVIRAQGPHQPGRTIALGADGPKSICLGERSANGLPLPPMPAQAKCTNTPAVEGPDGVSSSARCSFADIVTVIRKLDAKTWEMKADIKMHTGAGGAGMLDFDAQRKRYEAIAKTSTNPDSRANAEAVLKNWEQYKANLTKSATSAAGSGAIASTTTVVSRLTRIGDSCKSGVPAG